MAIVTRADADVDAPADEIYDIFANVDTLALVMGALSTVQRIDRFRSQWTTHLGGLPHTIYVDVVEDRPGRRLSWQSTDGRVFNGEAEFTPVDDEQTRVRLRYTWEFASAFEFGDSSIPDEPDLARLDLQRLDELLRDNRSGSRHSINDQATAD